MGRNQIHGAREPFSKGSHPKYNNCNQSLRGLISFRIPAKPTKNKDSVDVRSVAILDPLEVKVKDS